MHAVRWRGGPSSLFLAGLVACASAPSAPSSGDEGPSPATRAPISEPTPEPFELLLEEASSSTVAEEAPGDRRPEPPPAPEAPPPRPPERLLILGDSMAATDFGQALEQVLTRDHPIKTARRGKSSTGLARPDFFDWMEEGRRQVALHRPDLVIVILGGNDGQDLIQKGGGPRVFWGRPEWASAYAQRLERFTRVLAQEGRPVVFLGLPLMDRPRLEAKLRLIREVQRRTIEALPGASYLDTRTCFVAENGKLLRTVELQGWRSPQPLRQDDGIHLTVPGARHFAECTVGLLEPLLRPRPTPSS